VIECGWAWVCVYVHVCENECRVMFCNIRWSCRSNPPSRLNPPSKVPLPTATLHTSMPAECKRACAMQLLWVVVLVPLSPPSLPSCLTCLDQTRLFCGLETIPVRVRVPIGVVIHLAGELHRWWCGSGCVFVGWMGCLCNNGAVVLRAVRCASAVC